MARHKLTKLFVEKFSLPESGQVLIWDTELPGFGLRVGLKTKAFVAEAKIKRKTIRYTVGTFPRMTPEVARSDARRILQDMERGIDPRGRNEAIPTLSQAYETFKRIRQLAERTRTDYDRYYNVYFHAWKNRPLNEITPPLVSKRHLDIAEKHGEAQANAGMRFLRSVLYFSQAEYGRELIPENPVKTLGHKRQWFREFPRQNVIKAHELPQWFAAGLAIKNDKTSKDRETMRDFFLICLFLGLRRSEALKLRWENVDLKAKTITIPQTKNYEPKTLPYGPYIEQMLKARLEVNPASLWVFHSALNPQKPIRDPKKALKELVKTSKIKHTIHDLRRSFATFLEGLDVSVYATRKLMGHRASSDDVLGRHYVVTDVERLRPAIEKLEAYILSAAKIQPQGEVVMLDTKRGKS